MSAPGPRSESGFAIYASVLVLLLGVIAVGVTYYRPAPKGVGATVREADVFAQVKAALIGHAARQGVFQCTNPGDATACATQLESARLGEFPCPDTNNDGLAEASCPTARLGRVPWRTLGIPEPKDKAGETLWYAVSALWVNREPTTTNTAINSSTPGDLSVLSADGSSATSAAVAVILSPGSVVQNQVRSPALAMCGATSNVRGDWCAANYLEAQGTGNNAVVTGSFISGTPGTAFNDRLVYILATDVVPVLEMRLGNEIKSLLLAYKFGSKCLCYPWADSWAYSGGIADFGINRGRLASIAAYNRASTSGTLEPEEWGTGSIPRFPLWLFDNDWHNQLYYLASRQETNPTLGGCLTCTTNAYLTIQNDTSTTAAVAFLTPGTPRNGSRPYLPSVAGTTAGKALMNNFSLFFDDSMNRKNGCAGETTEHATDPGSYSFVSVGINCDTLTRPASRSNDRNRLFTIKPEADLDAATVCPKAGPALYRATPCHDPAGVNQLSAVCTRLISTLQKCSTTCNDAADQMALVPCRNNRTAAGCSTYHTALLSCSAP